MTSLESGWSSGGGGPVFMNQPNYFGAAPAHSWSHNSGPYFGEAGSTGNGMLSTRPSRDAAFVPFFGIPTKEDIPDPYEAYDIENLQLPDGFKGNRPYLKYIILKQVTLAEQYPYREAAPFVRNDHSQEICWDMWVFNNHLLGRTPEESVSRMLTMNVTQSRESMVRYGIALMLEHGFMRTPKGRENYRRNLDQIAAATATTLAYGAMYALLNSKYSDPNNKYRRQHTRNLYEMQQLFREEIVNFGIVQKKLDGYKIVSEKCTERLKQQVGRGGNYTIVPPRVTKYRPPQSFITAADKLPLMWDKMLGDPANGGSPPMGTVKESVGYRVGEHQPNDDPCIRERTIGGFFQMLPTNIEDVPPEEFKTHMMDTKIYSEDKDDWHLLRYADAVRQCGLFDEDWQFTDNLGRPFFQSLPGTWGGYLQHCGLKDAVLKQILKLGSEPMHELLTLFVSDRADSTRVVTAAAASAAAARHAAAVAVALAAGVGAPPIVPPLGSSVVAVPPIAAGAPLADLMRHFYGNKSIPSAVDEVRHLVPSFGAEGGVSATSSEIARRNEEAVSALTESSREVVSDRVRRDIKTFADVLRKADESAWADVRAQQTLTERYSELLPKLRSLDPPVQDSDLIVAAIAVMREQLERNDELRCLQQVRDQPTVLEDLLLQNSNTSHRNRKDADSKSPRWLPFGYGANNPPTHRLLVTAHSATSNELLLQNPSLALTLSSASLVLFNVSVEEYNSHLKVTGTSFTDLTLPTKPIAIEVPQESNQGDGLRFSLLQFSVTISMMYRVFHEYTLKLDKAVSGSKQAQADLYNQLAKHIWAVCPRLHPLWQDTEHYMNDVNAHVDNMPLLLCQTRFHRVVMELRSLAKAVINDPSSTVAPLAAIKAVHLVFAQLLLEHGDDNFVHFSDVHQAVAVSGGDVDLGISHVRSIILPKLGHATAIAAGSDSIAAFRRKIRSEAGSKTSAMISELKTVASSPADQEKLKDVVNIFGNSIMDTWEAIQVFQTSLSSTDKELFWKAIFRSIYEIFLSEKSVLGPIFAARHFISDATNDIMDPAQKTFTANNFWGPAVDAAGRKIIYTTVYDSSIRKSRKDANDVGRTLAAFQKSVSLARLFRGGAGGQSVSSVSSTPASHFSVSLSEKMREAIANGSLTPLTSASNAADILRYNEDVAKLVEAAKNEALEVSSVVSSSVTAGPSPFALLANIFDEWSVRDGRFIAFGIKYHMWPLLGFLGFRPHKRYMMGTMIHMMGWGEAAKTYYGHADFQLGDNIAQKVHTGHFTMYAKTIVLRTDMVVRGDNVIVYDYEGGNGHRIWNPSDPDHVDAYRSNELDCDIFLAPVLPNYRCGTQFMDVSGRFSDRLSPNDDAQRATDYGPSARILSGIWGWRAIASPLNRDHFSNLAPKFSTLVFQERQILWDHSVRKLATYTHDHGHLGPDVGPGCKDWHTGADMYARPSGVAQRAPSGISAY